MPADGILGLLWGIIALKFFKALKRRIASRGIPKVKFKSYSPELYAPGYNFFGIDSTLNPNHS